MTSYPKISLKSNAQANANKFFLQLPNSSMHVVRIDLDCSVSVRHAIVNGQRQREKLIKKLFVLVVERAQQEEKIMLRNIAKPMQRSLTNGDGLIMQSTRQIAEPMSVLITKHILIDVELFTITAKHAKRLFQVLILLKMFKNNSRLKRASVTGVSRS
jgi:hypothetical protein